MADGQPNGEAAPILVHLVDRGLIRVIDIAFLAKGQDGSMTLLELSSLAEQSAVALDPGSQTAGSRSRPSSPRSTPQRDPNPPPPSKAE